ncbi:MAG: hypothetical protein ABI036_09955 [Fibrobacteria bacterium]
MHRLTAIFLSVSLLILLSCAAFFLAWSIISPRLRGEILNNSLEGKICALEARFGSPRILITGDSRANFQLIPAVFEAGTGSSCLNVAIAAGDLITSANALARHPELISRTKLIVISVGIYQINDGSLDAGFMSEASFAELGVPDHFRIFRKRPLDLLRYYREAFRLYRRREWKGMRFECGDYWTAGYDVYPGKGFYRAERVWNRQIGPDPLLANPWYMDLRLDGIRWRQFRETLERLDQLGIPTVVFQSPYGPTWMRAPENRGAIAAERVFASELSAFAKPLKNVHFLDFFSASGADRGDSSGAFRLSETVHPESLTDSLFYDAAHLNPSGAEIFSRWFLRELQMRKLLPDSTAE